MKVKSGIIAHPDFQLSTFNFQIFLLSQFTFIVNGLRTF